MRKVRVFRDGRLTMRQILFYVMADEMDPIPRGYDIKWKDGMGPRADLLGGLSEIAVRGPIGFPKPDSAEITRRWIPEGCYDMWNMGCYVPVVGEEKVDFGTVEIGITPIVTGLSLTYRNPETAMAWMEKCRDMFDQRSVPIKSRICFDADIAADGQTYSFRNAFITKVSAESEKVETVFDQVIIL